jgi:hypothetical protein
VGDAAAGVFFFTEVVEEDAAGVVFATGVVKEGAAGVVFSTGVAGTDVTGIVLVLVDTGVKVLAVRGLHAEKRRVQTKRTTRKTIDIFTSASFFSLQERKLPTLKGYHSLTL